VVRARLKGGGGKERDAPPDRAVTLSEGKTRNSQPPWFASGKKKRGGGGERLYLSGSGPPVISAGEPRQRHETGIDRLDEATEKEEKGKGALSFVRAAGGRKN